MLETLEGLATAEEDAAAADVTEVGLAATGEEAAAATLLLRIEVVKELTELEKVGSAAETAIGVEDAAAGALEGSEPADWLQEW